MGKIIAGTALAGWAAIAWLAWHMADSRIASCASADFDNCVMRLTAQRDYILIASLIVGLAILISIMLIWSLLKARQGSAQPGSKPSWRSASRAPRVMLRSGE